MPKKRQIQPENTIGGRIDLIIDYFHINAKQFAYKLNISEGNLSDIRKGKAELTRRVIRSLETIDIQGKQINIEWLLTGEGEMFTANHIDIPEDYKKSDVFIMAGAGNPYQLMESEPIDTLWLRKEFLNNHIVVVKARGHSMEPTIMNGAFLGVDTADRQIVSGEMYALWIPHEGAIIKRLNVDPRGMIQIISDNSDNKRYPAVSLELRELDENFIQGRVKWVIQKV